ncbi:hypothetical protein EJ08DRAFT_700359 [Tothia fuscella]|uniref:Uncharacterized protein n=1 Tax=Tothia fuscella TaxID=1048955 RepID=A0A9P4NKS9_9PEZI|nr:hypothetical protein EJ08DRAFT_700359 [Tothia fuscella]
MFYQPDSFRNYVRLAGIKSPEVHRAIPPVEAANFVSGTAIDTRSAVGFPNDEMGLFVNGVTNSMIVTIPSPLPGVKRPGNERGPRVRNLGSVQRSFQGQPLGLLRYVPSISRWTAGKISQKRDYSYKVSNLGAFDAVAPLYSAGNDHCQVTKMVFSQSADAVGAPMTITVVTVEGRSMIILILWQLGALGIPFEQESNFVDGISAFLEEDFGSLD